MKYNVDFEKSKSVHWSTPKKLYDYYMSYGYLDPCPLNSPIDNLNVDYFDKKLFINPPFSDLDKWVDFAIRQHCNGCRVVILMPCRMDTNYFYKLSKLQPFLWFFKGRLKFGESNNSAPFPTMLVCLTFGLIFSWYQCGTMEDLIKNNKMVERY